MKTAYFEMVTMLLTAVVLMDIFQVKAEVLDMADDAFDDEYLRCSDRMEIKYIPQLLEEEKASQQLLKVVWENAKAKWEARKTQLTLPLSFKDNYGIALMAYISEAQKQTDFYHQFKEAVMMAGRSRRDYIYDFQFKAFHFYLTRAQYLLRRPCEDNYKNVVYFTSQISFTFGGLNQARFGHFTLAYFIKPQASNDQNTLLTIYTCFGVPVEKFANGEEKVMLIPLNEVFHVSQDGTSKNLILHSANKTCSHYECAFVGGLKTENCAENMEYLQFIYAYNLGDRSRLHDTAEQNPTTSKPKRTTGKPAGVPGATPGKPGAGASSTRGKPGAGASSTRGKPGGVPGATPGKPATAFPPTRGAVPGAPPGAPTTKSTSRGPGGGSRPNRPSSSGKMPLPSFGVFSILISASVIKHFVAL